MPRSTRAARRRLPALAALQLMLAAAGAAVPSLHLGAARHHHVFCPEHERFEDQASAWGAERASSAPGYAAHRGTERSHAACAFSNLLLRPMLSGPAERAPASHQGTPVESTLSLPEGHAALAALHLAPKQSPPPAGPTLVPG